MKISSRSLATAGLVAASYAVLSLVFHPISFGVYQVRVAEALTILPFLLPAAVPGLFIGCLIANIMGGMGWLDIVIGPIITLIAALATYYIGRLPATKRIQAGALVPIAAMWAGGVYLLTGFEFDFLAVMGAVLSLVAILPLVLITPAPPKTTEDAKDIVRDRFWSTSTIALIVAVASVPIMNRAEDTFLWISGFCLIVAFVFSLGVLIWTSRRGFGANLLLAPLPPVLFNAFGVAAYLAPIAGLDYWFSVQMIGVGQLIACYIIGLPILLILKRRHIFG